MSMDNRGHPGDIGYDDLMCTICFQGLRTGAIRVEEHPVVPGVAVCHRCSERLQLSARNSEEEAEDERCAWCGDDDGPKLFVCDDHDCGRTFCDSCVEKLDGVTAASLEMMDDEWLCPCCDETSLAGLQAHYTFAVENPSLLSRVLARLAKSESVLLAQDNPDGDSDAGSASEKGELQAGDDAGARGAEASERRRSTECATAEHGSASVGQTRQEDEAFDQDLIDAACVVDREIDAVLEQMDEEACKKRKHDIAEELRRDMPHVSPKELDLVLSADVRRVLDMWQIEHDALMDVQATIKEALRCRGFCEAEIMIRDAQQVAGESGLGVKTTKEDDDGESRHDSDSADVGPSPGSFLKHVEAAASNESGHYDTANSLLSKCNALWSMMLDKLSSPEQDDSLGASGIHNGSTIGDGDLSCSPYLFDARFFRSAIRSVNCLPGLEEAWTDRTVAAGVAAAVSFFDKDRPASVDSPSTEDVISWGLVGARAEQLGISIRWMRNQVLVFQRVQEERLLSPRLPGEEEDPEHQPPSDRAAVVAECKVLQQQIQALNSFWDGSAEQAFWTTASDDHVERAWRSLRSELHAALQDAESTAPLLATGGTTGGRAGVFQAEDLGTSAEAWIRSSLTRNRRKGQLGSAKQAARKLREAIARENFVATIRRSEADDSQEIAKERVRAVAADVKPHRPRAPRRQHRRREKAPSARAKPGQKEALNARRAQRSRESQMSKSGRSDRGHGACVRKGFLSATGQNAQGKETLETAVVDAHNINSDRLEAAGPSANETEGGDATSASDDQHPARTSPQGTGATLDPLARDDNAQMSRLKAEEAALPCSDDEAPPLTEVDQGPGRVSDSEISQPRVHPCAPSNVGPDENHSATGEYSTGDKLTAFLRNMGVGDDDLAQGTRQGLLHELLASARGDVASAAHTFFWSGEDGNEEEARAEQARTLQRGEWPCDATCYLCGSNLPGEWKWMRSNSASGDALPMKLSNKPGEVESMIKDHERDGMEGHLTLGEETRTLSSGAACRDRQYCTQSACPSSLSSSASASTSITSTGTRKQGGPRHASRDQDKAKEHRDGRPRGFWVCGRRECLDGAKGLHYSVEVVYRVEHFLCTDDAELSSDGIHRRLKLKSRAKHIGSEVALNAPGEDEEDMHESADSNVCAGDTRSEEGAVQEFDANASMPDAKANPQDEEAFQTEARDACAVVLSKTLEMHSKTGVKGDRISSNEGEQHDRVGLRHGGRVGGEKALTNDLGEAGRGGPRESSIGRRDDWLCVSSDEELSHSDADKNMSREGKAPGGSRVSSEGSDDNTSSDENGDSYAAPVSMHPKSRVSRATCDRRRGTGDPSSESARRRRACSACERETQVNDMEGNLLCSGCLMDTPPPTRGTPPKNQSQRQSAGQHDATGEGSEEATGRAGHEERRSSDSTRNDSDRGSDRLDALDIEESVIDLASSEDEGGPVAKQLTRGSPGPERSTEQLPAQKSQSRKALLVGFWESPAKGAINALKKVSCPSVETTQSPSTAPEGLPQSLEQHAGAHPGPRPVHESATDPGDTHPTAATEEGRHLQGEQPTTTNPVDPSSLRREESGDEAGGHGLSCPGPKGPSTPPETLENTRKAAGVVGRKPHSSGGDDPGLDTSKRNLDTDNPPLPQCRDEDVVDSDTNRSSARDSDSDSDEDVVFLDVQQGTSRKREGRLDEKQEREVAGLQRKELERLKKVAESKGRTPAKPKIYRSSLLERRLGQSPVPPRDLDNIDAPAHAYVLEALPPKSGEKDGKIVHVPAFLGKHLFDHQVEGVQFMYDNLVVNTEQLGDGGEGSQGNGCILAHCMGLGKTLQAITIVQVLLCNEVVQAAATIPAPRGAPSADHGNEGSEKRPSRNAVAQATSASEYHSGVDALGPPGTGSNSGCTMTGTLAPLELSATPRSFLRTCLVLVPKNVLRNWHDELRKWLSDFYREGKVFVVDSGKLEERLRTTERWYERGGILVMSYSILRITASKTGETGERFRELLLDPGPDVVVADEAHLLKNEEAQVTVMIKKMRTKRRIALTGSPLQNNLVEYYTMVDFVRKGLLGDLDRFKSFFEAPIVNGMLADSSPFDVKRSQGRSHVLHQTLRGFVQRKDVSVMAKALPPHVKKEEIVLTVALTKRQKGLTQKIFREAKKVGSEGLLMRVLANLQLAWAHPAVYEADQTAKAARAAAQPLGAAAEDSDGDSGALCEMAPDNASKEGWISSDARPHKRSASAPGVSGDGSLALADPNPAPAVADAAGPAPFSTRQDERRECLSVDQVHYNAAWGNTAPPRAARRGVGNGKGSSSSLQLSAVASGDNKNEPPLFDHDLVGVDAAMPLKMAPASPTADPRLASQGEAKRRKISFLSKEASHHGGTGPFRRNSSKELPEEDFADAACSEANVLHDLTVSAVVAEVAESGWGGTAQRSGKRRRCGLTERKSHHKQKLRPLDNGLDMHESAKAMVAVEIVARAVKEDDKVLIYSQRTPVLDFLERVFMTKGFGGCVRTPPAPVPTWRLSLTSVEAVWGPWSNGKHYFRLDGSTTAKKRQSMIDAFNESGNKDARVFLLSTRAGNMGINLVAANRVIIMDTSWNPANDLQAMFRCYRFGQTKSVEVYRLVMGRSLENKMHNKQITKHALAGRIVDARNPGRRFTLADQTLDLHTESSRYEETSTDTGNIGGAGERSLGAVSPPSEVVVVTEKDAETLAVDNEKLADILDLVGDDSGDEPASEHAENKTSGTKTLPSPGDGGPTESSAADDDSLFTEPPRGPHAKSSGSSGANGRRAAQPVPLSMVVDGEGESAPDKHVEDPVLAHLLDAFYPKVISSWVANKRLLEDDPLDKLDDAGKAEATRQYNEELKLQQLGPRQRQGLEAERAHAFRAGVLDQRRSREESEKDDWPQEKQSSSWQQHQRDVLRSIQEQISKRQHQRAKVQTVQQEPLRATPLVVGAATKGAVNTLPLPKLALSHARGTSGGSGDSVVATKDGVLRRVEEIRKTHATGTAGLDVDGRRIVDSSDGVDESPSLQVLSVQHAIVNTL